MRRDDPSPEFDNKVIIRSHHERWDGTGYPEQLAGTDIPLGARIFMVCDVYDALVSTRPYKAAWKPEEALRELQSQAGRQFDPQVIEAFLSLYRVPEGIKGQVIAEQLRFDAALEMME